jgi:DNA-directed RNA polymerase specialized sigma24 family protein
VNENDATDLVAALFDRWYMSLVRYALRTTANYELAEGLAQETFMQLYQALRTGTNIEHPKAWTICVLRRAMSRRMRDLRIRNDNAFDCGPRRRWQRRNSNFLLVAGQF